MLYYSLDSLSQEKKNLIYEIKFLFGLNQDANSQLELYFDSNLSEQDLDLLQQVFVSFILNDQLLTKFRPSCKYLKQFLKKIISVFEKLNIEINENIYDYYIQLLNEPQFSDSNEQTYFLIFYSKTDVFDEPVVIEQYMSIIANGTTGLHVWPACFQLIDYLNKNKNLLEKKNILELGSGVGLLGLHCLKLNSSIQNYCFTDCHEMVLKQIEKNCSFNNRNSNVSIKKLDWCCPDESDIFKDEHNLDLDLILASDIIFDPDLMPSLSKTLSFIWSKQTEAKILNLLIASTIRNETTYSHFLKNLEKENFKYETIEKKTSITKSTTPDCLIEILKIYK